MVVKKSIKTRLVKNFMLVIIITVLILEIILINGIKNYYYKSVEDILSNQIGFSTDFYSRYFASFNVEDILIDDIDVFWKHTNAQVQLLTLEGDLLMDSLGVVFNEPIRTSDVLKAQNLEKGVWIGNVQYDKYPVLSVSVPLINQGTPIGIVRFVSSLKDTNMTIKRITYLMIAIGAIVISISGVVSLFLANSIVRPLQEVTRAAEKMADGQLNTRSSIQIDDEIGRLSDTLNYMAEEILKKEQIKNDFISSVSHELKTPLTSIKGWAITLKTDENEENRFLLDGLEIIEKESDRLAAMVDELLDFSRFISGRISLNKENFNIHNTIRMIGKQSIPRARSKNIKLEVNIDEDIDMMLGDENRIKQVLINLLDNSIKFTEDGGKVKLSAYKENENLVLEVEDNGIGISSEDLPNVKEKFYKGKNSKSNSGIGLSICQEIVKLHDGELNIESELGIGTTVRAVIPLKEE